MNILEEAIKVTQERQVAYDKPEDNFNRICTRWNNYLSDKYPGIQLEPKDVAIMMIDMKLARIQWKYSRDSTVDIAGYAHCLARIEGEYEGNDTD